MHSIHRLLGNSANSSAWENCFMCSKRRRKSANHWAVAKLACVLFLVSSVSLAQRVVTATANIPFEFWAEGQKFAASEYIFDSGFPGSTSVHRKGTKLTVGVPIISYGDPVRKEDARVVFVLRDGKYYLAEFWGILDRRVVTAEFDHRGQTTAGQRDVQFSYP
jgi:hypothetical protein